MIELPGNQFSQFNSILLKSNSEDKTSAEMVINSFESEAVL
jgi:hypothetical protein